MENQVEKNMENEMETGIIQGITGIRVSKIRGTYYNGESNGKENGK